MKTLFLLILSTVVIFSIVPIAVSAPIAQQPPIVADFFGYASSISYPPRLEPGQDNRNDISWTFTVFEEPDFRATPMGRFAPQPLNIIQQRGDGWVLISTYLGVGWVYTNSNRVFIDRITGIFDERGDAAYVSLISPQTVRVIEEYDGWIKIPTWLGEKWVDLNFTPPTAELDRLMQRFGNTVSVHFENLETGFIYTHNAERVYFAASSIKAPYALYVYLRAERGEADLSRVHTFQPQHMWGGSGRIQRMPFGTTFTELELLNYALSISDNVAFRMLVHNIYGVPGYRDLVASLGANPDHVRNVTSGNMTANDAGIMARAMHEYIESGGTYSEHFRSALLANRYPFIISDHQVASKSGWDVGAYHDIAIVYAPSPYTLVIMSSFVGNAADRRVFHEISMAFQRFNDRYFLPQP